MFMQNSNSADYRTGAGVYADLLLDYTFKKAFNPEGQTKVCLIALLNAILEGEMEDPIRDVRSRDKELAFGSNENRRTIFDLYCDDTRGRRFIVEVQLAKLEHSLGRAVFYSAQSVIEQGRHGKDFDYAIEPVITVVLMDFEAFPEDRRHLRHGSIRERTGSQLTDLLHFSFVELPKFDKKENELETELDYALYALRHIKELRRMPESYSGSPFELLFHISEVAKLSKEEQRMIDLAQKAKWDDFATHKYAHDSGYKEGLDRGALNAKKSIARAMLKAGDSPQKVACISGLSEEEIREL